jgi:hypothetical protein
MYDYRSVSQRSLPLIIRTLGPQKDTLTLNPEFQES